MNEKDVIIIKNSSLAVIDVILNNIPLLNSAWGLSKALLGASMELRQKRALEWVEMIRDNPSIFSGDVLKDEVFQDGFVFLLEKFLRQRNEEKRKYIKNVFLDFAQSDEKIGFEIERIDDVINKITMRQVNLLKEVKKKTAMFHIPHDTESVEIRRSSGYDPDYDHYKYLEFLGLIAVISEKKVHTKYGASELEESETLVITKFGEVFINYLLTD